MTNKQLDRYYRALRLDILRFARLAKLSYEILDYKDYSHQTRLTDPFRDAYQTIRNSLGSPIYVHVILWAQDDVLRPYLLSMGLRCTPADMMVSRDKRVREATIRRLAGSSIMSDEEYMKALNLGRSKLKYLDNAEVGYLEPIND